MRKQSLSHVPKAHSLLLQSLALAFSMSTAGAMPAIANDAKKQNTEELKLSTGPALMSIVSLNKQRMWVYGADGLITQTRVSTGTGGYDTPKGIYSVIQKKKDHSSNLYEGAPMPHMQRLLWTGIAMHGGAVPNYPASHGCIRLPWDFAEQYFSMTKLGHRVIISPNVRAPVAFSHPSLFRPIPDGDPETARLSLARLGPDLELPSLPRTKALANAERAEEYTRLVEEDAAAKAVLAIAQSKVAEATAALTSAQQRLKESRQGLDKIYEAWEKADRIADLAEIKHRERVVKTNAKAWRLRADALERLRADDAAAWQRVQPLRRKADAASADLASAKSAIEGYQRLVAEAELHSIDMKRGLERDATTEAAAAGIIEDFRIAERNRPRPISVFISSRTGRVSMRQGFEPVGEGPAEIENIGRPLGTYIFTAVGWRDLSQTELTWNVVSVDERGLSDNQYSHSRDTKVPPQPTDVVKAQLALDRIRIPDDIRARIGEVVKPGSSLIISDYDMSRSETSKGTDFIVQMPEVVARVVVKPKKKRENARARRSTSRVAESRSIKVKPIKISRYRPDPVYRGIFGYDYD